MEKRIYWVLVMFFTLHFSLFTQDVAAQPAARKAEQKAATAQKSNANNMTTRAQISFPAAATMSEDVVWRRDIYREIDLNESANSGLYYPEEPNGDKMNLFTYLFKLMITGKIKVYEYRLDGNEVFNDSARVKPLEFLDNYGIYYERNGKAMHIDNSDIPSRDVKAYYLKESAYYDQASATFHKKVIALCPIMMRDDFGDASQKYPLFWVKYDDIAPFLAKQTIMTSDLNNAATMSADDYFTKNQYKGQIYKTTNMLGKTLSQIVAGNSMDPDAEDAMDESVFKSKLTAEQKRIESEIEAFEKNLFGNQARKDSLDSIRVAQTPDKKAKKSARKTSGSTSSVKSSSSSSARKSKSKSSGSSKSSSSRMSVRRERH